MRQRDFTAARFASGMNALGRGTGGRHAVNAELHMPAIVNRHPPEQRLLPADLGIGRQGGHVEHIGHAELLDTLLAIRTLVDVSHTPS
jgi:hypothetical protein